VAGQGWQFGAECLVWFGQCSRLAGEMQGGRGENYLPLLTGGSLRIEECLIDMKSRIDLNFLIDNSGRIDKDCLIDKNGRKCHIGKNDLDGRYCLLGKNCLIGRKYQIGKNGLVGRFCQLCKKCLMQWLLGLNHSVDHYYPIGSNGRGWAHLLGINQKIG